MGGATAADWRSAAAPPATGRDAEMRGCVRLRALSRLASGAGHGASQARESVCDVLSAP
jgi:hypothetical protein